MVGPLSGFMYRVERTRREYCSFPTVIKSYDCGDPGAAVRGGGRQSEVGGQRGAGSPLPCCPQPLCHSPIPRRYCNLPRIRKLPPEPQLQCTSCCDFPPHDLSIAWQISAPPAQRGPFLQHSSMNSAIKESGKRRAFHSLLVGTICSVRTELS